MPGFLPAIIIIIIISCCNNHNNNYNRDFYILYHVPCIFYYLHYDQQMHNYFTNYHTATCFDTIVSSSDIL